MSKEIIIAWDAVAERVRELAAGDAELDARLRALARAVLAEPQPPQVKVPGLPEAKAESAPAAAGPTPISADQVTESVAEAEDGVAAPCVIPLVAAVAVRAAPPAAPAPPTVPERPHLPTEAPGGFAAPTARVEVTDGDLPLIEARCRLKAEGARWAATRRRRIAEGVDFRTEVEPLDREIIERANGLPDCFLWMCHPTGPAPSDLTLYEDVAGCFDALASATSLLRTVNGDPAGNRDTFEQSLDLLAEAQSALRRAVELVGGGPDRDQVKAYLWLRSMSAQHQIFISRYMRVDDPADPAAWADLDARIGQIDTTLQDARRRAKRRQDAVKRVRYHVKLILSGDRSDHAHDWRKVVEAVDQMVGDGVPPSNPEIRELLLPAIDDLPDPDGHPAGFRLVLREIDRYLATRPPASDAEVADDVDARVGEVAKLLAGRTVVLIGGVPRPHARQALKAAFGLKALDWVETREHESVVTFEPHVARPDVAVVILAIRWSSHAFGDVKQFCDRHGKPLVRLPGGYNPTQVAAQVLSQVSGRLGRDE